MFTPTWGKKIQFDLRIFFQMGWWTNHQLEEVQVDQTACPFVGIHGSSYELEFHQGVLLTHASTTTACNRLPSLVTLCEVADEDEDAQCLSWQKIKKKEQNFFDLSFVSTVFFCVCWCCLCMFDHIWSDLFCLFRTSKSWEDWEQFVFEIALVYGWVAHLVFHLRYMGLAMYLSLSDFTRLIWCTFCLWFSPTIHFKAEPANTHFSTVFFETQSFIFDELLKECQLL